MSLRARRAKQSPTLYGTLRGFVAHYRSLLAMTEISYNRIHEIDLAAECKNISRHRRTCIRYADRGPFAGMGDLIDRDRGDVVVLLVVGAWTCPRADL
mgnify:FL=1